MTTENPKVAGYIPQEIFDALLNFKDREGHKSISQALTYILSDYLGVEQKVAYQSNLLFDDKFVSSDRFRELESRIDSLPSELLSESIKITEDMINQLRNELVNNFKSLQVSNELPSDLPSEPIENVSTGLLSGSLFEPLKDTNGLCLDVQNDSLSKLPSELDVTLVQPMNSTALTKRFNLPEGGVSKFKGKHKTNPQRFTEWTKTKDPDGIPWEYREEEKLYYPIF